MAVNFVFSFLVSLLPFSALFFFPLLLCISKPKNCPPGEVYGIFVYWFSCRYLVVLGLQLSAPQSRDSLRLRRRFLPLRKKSLRFFPPSAACMPSLLHLCLIQAQEGLFCWQNYWQIQQFCVPKNPGKIAYSSATRSKITGKFSSVKITVSGAMRAKLLADSAVLCLSRLEGLVAPNSWKT